MRYQFAPLTEEQARAIGAWRYDPPYDLYDMDTDEEGLRELLDQDTPYYGATDERGELVGFLCFKTAVQTLSGLLAGAYADPDTLDIGLGMRPDLTGRGLGLDFMNAGLAFARETFHPASFRLSVAAFNDRAIKVYKRAGFQPGHTFTHTAHTPRATNGVYEFMTIVRAAIDRKRLGCVSFEWGLALTPRPALRCGPAPRLRRRSDQPLPCAGEGEGEEPFNEGRL